MSNRLHLDSARPARGDIIAAMADARLAGAAIRADGRIVARPFTLTDGAVALLRGLRPLASRGSARPLHG